MSFLVQAFALLPAVAAIIVVLAALADRRDADTLRGLGALTLDAHLEPTASDDPESCAA